MCVYGINNTNLYRREEKGLETWDVAVQVYYVLSDCEAETYTYIYCVISELIFDSMESFSISDKRPISKHIFRYLLYKY